jgi:hypothetical protein
MTNTLRNGIWLGTIMATFALLFGTFSAPISQIQAANKTPDPPTKVACDALKDLGGADCDDANESTLIKVARAAINIISLIVGVASVIVIIIAGFRFIISGGDSQAIASSRNTIIYAVVGLIIVVFAQVIVAFVLNRTK